MEKGEIVSIIGPSGSGKSTFLRTLIGLEKADAGSVSIDGLSVFENGTDAPSATRAAARRADGNPMLAAKSLVLPAGM